MKKAHANVLKKVAEVLRCAICNLALSEAVVFPGCLHTFCKRCLEGKKETITCKTCENSCKKEQLAEVPIISELVEAGYQTCFIDQTT